ncbi:MAG: hypothetical protein ACI4J8_08645 [Oscillospiraceae bacterium]
MLYGLHGCCGEGFCPNKLAPFAAILTDEEAARQLALFDEIVCAFQ